MCSTLFRMKKTNTISLFCVCFIKNCYTIRKKSYKEWLINSNAIILLCHLHLQNMMKWKKPVTKSLNIYKKKKILITFIRFSRNVRKSLTCSRTLLKKRHEGFGDDIFITHHPWKNTLIYYKVLNLSQTCNKWLSGPCLLRRLEKKSILYVAAEILRSEIMKVLSPNEFYAPAANMLNTVVSDILRKV